MATIAILDLQLKAGSLDTAHKVIHATLTDTRAFPGCLGHHGPDRQRRPGARDHL